MERKRLRVLLVSLLMGACFMAGLICSRLWYKNEILEMSYDLKRTSWYEWVLEGERDRLQQEVDSLKVKLNECLDDNASLPYIEKEP